MDYTSTLASKNQTTIPKAVVAVLGITPSAKLCYELEPDGSVRLTAKAATFEGLAASFSQRKGLRQDSKPASVAQMQTAVKASAVKRFTKASL